MPRNRTSVFHFFLSVIVLSLLSLYGAKSSAQSAETGKITAKIIDEKTGEPLLRASVKILETNHGALSKENGVATIILVPPSDNYTVVAKYAGYQSSTAKNVEVKSGQTTQLTFKLSTKAQDTITVTTNRLVDVSKTESGSKFNSKELQSIANVQNISQVAALTTGVIADGSNGGVSIHGSRGNQNSVKLNGMETTNPVSGNESIAQLTISKFAVAEVSVATSGLGANQGNTNGGVISTTTNKGTEDFTMRMGYRTDVPALFGTSSNGYKQMGAVDHTYELAIGGPIASGVKYFLTAKGQTQQYHGADINPYTNQSSGLNVIDPSGNNLGQLPYSQYYLRGITGNLSFDLFGLQFSGDVALNSINRQFTSWGVTYGDPAEIPARNQIDNIYTLTTKVPVGTGILTLIGGYEYSSDQIGKYDFAQGGGLFSMYKIYQANDNFTYDDNTHTITPGGDGIVDIYTPVSKIIASPSSPGSIYTLSGAGINPFTGRIEGPGIAASTNNPYGLYNSFLAAGNVQGFSNQFIDHIQLQSQYNDQFGSHGIDAGVEAHLYNIQNYDNQLPWDANPFRDSFTIKPLIADVYIQDKMEFSDIVFQPGIRFDLYNPNNNHVLLDPYNPIVNGKANFTTAPVQTLLSPRLAINYAVTEKTYFSFNYGLYFNKPPFLYAITNTGGDLSAALARGNQIFGNGALKGETDEVIDIGFETGLTDVIKTSVHGIFKKMNNITGLARITSPNLPVGYQLYTDNEYGSYKGLEIVLKKQMSDNYSITLNYTYSTAVGTSSTAEANYAALINQPSNGPNSVLPLQPYPLDFDRTHVAQLLLNLVYRKGEGPKISGIPILENFNFATKTIFYTGTPYTATDIKGVQIGEHNGNREPSYFQTDATITRNIALSDLFGSGIGSSWLEIQLEWYNLFNSTQALSVYPATGQGDDDGSVATYGGTYDYINDPTNASGNEIDALGMLKYNPKWDLNKDGRVSIAEQTAGFLQQRKDSFARRTNYQVPRRIFLNFALHF
jgi:hypothetical protein